MISSQAQNKVEISTNFIQENLHEYKLTKADLKDWKVSDNYVTQHNGVNHVYYQQTYKGIPVEHALINVNILPDGEVLAWNSRFVYDLSKKISGKVEISALDAVHKSLAVLEIEVPKELKEIQQSKGVQEETVFEAFGNLEKDITSKLIYVILDNDQVRSAWRNEISFLKPEFHEWKVYIDASTGEFIKQVDQVIHCSFGENEDKCTADHDHDKSPKLFDNKSTTNNAMAGMYTVFAYPVESPNHGNRTIVTDPADPIASPYGWHDTDGVAGAEYTITRGNNVLAQDDVNGNNGTGFSPDGGASLVFDYTLDFGESPAENTPAAQNMQSSITNLFYWNNIIHDVFYKYGFDEVSGNFQENNYGKGGVGNDYVLADALDGSGTNNANFSTPNDGGNGRMQMFLWNASSSLSFTVNAPTNVAGAYNVVGAQFGASNYNITGDVVEADDGSSNPSEACNALTNGAAMAGKIALIDRGNCQFGVKVLNAENAGAIAAIVCNNVAGASIAMGPGTDGASVTIPAVMISQADCATIRAELGSLNVTMNESSGTQQIDGSFDNGIIAHEYGHGISIRLTGGPSSSCLNNDEQAGEGWSDFFGLVLTHEPGDTRNTPRGIGTYALGENPFGDGIRTYPYTADMAVNPSTYDDIKTFSVPHGVGSVFCTMLWDMYWDFVDEYGYDSDVYNGTGGNNIAIQLVIDGLKMQPCSPGFIDARDAILAADRINNGGANQCLIWNAFARRGLGFSALQGSSASRADGVEAYDLPSGIKIFDDLTAIEAYEGEEFQFTGTATCDCTAKTNVVLSHTIPAGMSIVSVQNGNISGNTIVSNSVSLNPEESIEISYTAKVDPCGMGSYTVLFEDDIEGSDNFTTQQLNIAGAWIKSTNPINSGTNAWYAENLATQSDFALVMNSPITITNSSVLSFFHKYSTETSWDGGVVEISTNNGTTWVGTEDKFILNGYPSIINVNPQSGISGQAAFTGISDDDFGTTNFVESKIDLSSFIGSSILVRFRFASDAFSAGAGLNGWVIDDIAIQDIPLVVIDMEVISDDGQEALEQQNVIINRLQQNVIYVDASSAGRTHGGDWTNAMKSLQDAIDIAACNNDISEVWVKSGVYIPSMNMDNNISFEFRSDSRVYGGFAGVETLLAQRDAVVNPTVLSGNLGGGMNSLHVISNTNITNALIDGFTIQDGNSSTLMGGGLLNNNSTVIVKNCRFQNNTANSGGAIANTGNSILTLEDCQFFENSSTTNVARAIKNANSQILLKNVTIIDMLAGDGVGNTIDNEGASSQLNSEGVVEVKKEE